MKHKQPWLAAALMALAAAGMAKVPEGQGSLGLGVEIQRDQLVQSGTGLFVSKASINNDWGLQEVLQGDFPIWSGLSGGLRVSNGQMTVNTDVVSIFGEQKVGSDNRLYGFDAMLNLYPAAFMEKPFQPGENANPDGWVYWPSVSLQYSLLETNQLGHTVVTGLGAGVSDRNTYSVSQTPIYGLVLPLQTWLTLSGTYQRNLQQDVSFNSSGNTSRSFGLSEAESADLTCYLNLVAGAGKDRGRAFVPHLGRVGQMMVDLGWSRNLNTGSQPVTGGQDYGLTVGAPLGDSLGLTFNATQVEVDTPPQNFANNLTVDNRNTWTYGLMASWAFGSAENREDQ